MVGYSLLQDAAMQAIPWPRAEPIPVSALALDNQALETMGFNDIVGVTSFNIQPPTVGISCDRSGVLVLHFGSGPSYEFQG